MHHEALSRGAFATTARISAAPKWSVKACSGTEPAGYNVRQGSVAERFKAPVLKTDDGKPSVSSNLTASATYVDAAGCIVRW